MMMIQYKGLEIAPDFTVKSEKSIRSAQDALDSKCIELMEDYTPISQYGGYTKASPHKWVIFTGRGKMSKSHKQESPGIIINTEPKARHEYYTNRGFSGQNRGKYWFERMKLDHMKDLLKAAEEGAKK